MNMFRASAIELILLRAIISMALSYTCLFGSTALDQTVDKACRRWGYRHLLLLLRSVVVQTSQAY